MVLWWVSSSFVSLTLRILFVLDDCLFCVYFSVGVFCCLDLAFDLVVLCVLVFWVGLSDIGVI